MAERKHGRGSCRAIGQKCPCERDAFLVFLRDGGGMVSDSVVTCVSHGKLFCDIGLSPCAVLLSKIVEPQLTRVKHRSVRWRCTNVRGFAAVLFARVKTHPPPWFPLGPPPHGGCIRRVREGESTIARMGCDCGRFGETPLQFVFQRGFGGRRVARQETRPRRNNIFSASELAQADLKRRRRSELLTTKTDENAMAAAANMGSSMPAIASGMSRML